MKYGDQLEQESVPEWSLHNVDYNSLKHEIKVHTTRDQATAVAIPGHRDQSLQKFEDRLYQELCSQHARVDLFVTSKADEIARRLESLAGQIRRLVAKCDRDNGARINLRRQRKFSKYERELLRCEEDILALSRFINAQAVAFRKIMKKYKKWTGSPSLSSRFRENVLASPKSFTRRDFSRLQDQYDEILGMLRGATSRISEPSSPSSAEPPSPTSLRRHSGSQGDVENRKLRFDIPPVPPRAQEPPTHYWNEYDYGSEGEGANPNDEYAIYIDPNADDSFPGMDSVRKILRRPLALASSWFSRQDNSYDRTDPSRQSLLPHLQQQREDDDDDEEGSSDDNAGPSRGYGSIWPYGADTDEDLEYASSEDNMPTAGYAGYYAALPSINDQRALRYRERALHWGTVGAFAASFVLLGVASVLIVTGRHRLRVEVDAGVTVGAAASLFCACLALGMALYRSDKLGVAYQAAVWTSFMASCVLNGMLLVLVVDNST